MWRFTTVALAFVAALGLIFDASSHPAAAASRSRISGNIKDALGRPLADTEVILQTPNGKIIERTKTDRDGHFQFGAVAAGSYAVVANKSATSQIAMQKATSDLVYATSGYATSVQNAAQVTLASDMVFSDGASLELPAMSGSVTGGLTAAITIAV